MKNNKTEKQIANEQLLEDAFLGIVKAIGIKERTK